MTAKTNYHTHTMYDDGKGTPEEIIKEAIEKGFTVLGFSGHAFAPHETGFCMSEKDTVSYRREINSLKKKYGDRIRILCGIEKDYFAPADSYEYDYVIGSVHYVKKNGEYIPVDLSAEALKSAAEKHYGGDIYPLIEDYFALVGDVCNKTECGIIGHFDLITKFSEKTTLFDTGHKRYTEAALAAVGRLIPSNAVFEINTGAISRGYRTSPYPSEFLIREIHARGGRFVLDSDCHEKSALDCHFDEVIKKYADRITMVPEPF